jgi:predicted transcriptional regulator
VEKSEDKVDKKTTKTTLKKEAFIVALEKALGIVSQAAKQVGIDRTTPYRWMKEDEEFKDRVEEIQNVVGDFAETKLYELVNDGNPSAVIFLCKTKFKNRGYVERQEITGVDGSNLDISIEVVYPDKD